MSGAILRFDDEDAAPPSFEPKRTLDRDLQRASGEARLVFAEIGGRTRPAELYQKAPLRVLFPALDGAAAEAVLANTAGGIAGGDTLSCRVTVGERAVAAVTTQAAEKVYRALDSHASVQSSLHLADRAALAWLPQETILFDAARLRRRTEVHLEPNSELLALEWVVLGRTARGETLTSGELTDAWTVRLGGRLVWADAFRLPSHAWNEMSRPALLAGCAAFVTAILYAPGIAQHLEDFRDLLQGMPCRAGVTSLARLLVFRFASADAVTLRAALTSFLSRASGIALPGLFRVPKMWSC